MLGMRADRFEYPDLIDIVIRCTDVRGERTIGCDSNEIETISKTGGVRCERTEFAGPVEIAVKRCVEKISDSLTVCVFIRSCSAKTISVSQRRSFGSDIAQAQPVLETAGIRLLITSFFQQSAAWRIIIENKYPQLSLITSLGRKMLFRPRYHILFDMPESRMQFEVCIACSFRMNGTDQLPVLGLPEANDILPIRIPRRILTVETPAVPSTNLPVEPGGRDRMSLDKEIPDSQKVRIIAKRLLNDPAGVAM
jgi:hypothetical protein